MKTNRKRASVQGTKFSARDTRERFREKIARITLDSLVQVVGLLDAQGMVLDLNPAALEAAGLKLADVEGRPFWTTFGSPVSEAIQATLRESIARASQGEFVQWRPPIDKRAGRRDASQQFFSFRPVRDEAGQVVFITIEGRDPAQVGRAGPAQQAELQWISDHTPLIITRCSRDLRYLFVNRAAAAFFGRIPEQMIGQPIVDIIGEAAFAVVRPHIEQVLQGKRVDFEAPIPYAVAGRRWVQVTYLPDRDAHGQVQGWLASITDITERKLAQAQVEAQRQRMQVLAEASHAFAEAGPDLQPVLNVIVQQLGQRLGDGAIIRLPSDDGRTHTLAALYHPDREALAFYRELNAAPLRPDEGLSGQVFTTGQPLFLPVVTADHRRAGSPPRVWPDLGKFQIHSSLIVPLRVQAQIIGTLSLSRDLTRQAYTEDDLQLTMELADRAALAIENARLYAAARQSQWQQEALFQLADQLHHANTQDDILAAALTAILRALRGDRASILLFDDGGVMRFVAWRGLSDAYRQATEGHSPWTPDEKNAVPIAFDTVATADLSDALKAVILGEGIGALAFIPLTAEGQLIGKFMVYFNRPHTFSAGELELGLTIARQLAFGIGRNRTELKLLVSEQRFRTLSNTVPSMVWTAAPDGAILYVNDAWVDYTGLAPEPTGEQWFAVLHPEDRERFRRAWAQAIETGPDEFLIEVRSRRHDGEYRWFQTRAVPARDGAGRVSAWYGLTTDIHDRKETEHRLILLAEISELTRRFEDPRELMLAIATAVGKHLRVQRCLFNETDLDHDQEIVYDDYHHGGESVAGVHRLSDYSSLTSAEIAAGKTVVNVDSKTDPRTAADYDRTYGPSGERAYVAVPMLRAGRWVATLWVSDDVPRAWSKDDVSLLETIAERTWPVIEKARINAALRASETTLRVITDTTPALIAYVDAQQRYRFVNKTYTDWFGRATEDVVGKHVWEIVGEAAYQTVQPHIQQALSGNTVTFDHLLPYQDGGARFVLGYYIPDVEADGTAKGYFSLIQDITERKQAEEQIKRSEERFRQAADAAGALIYEVNLESGATAVVYGLERVVGYSPPDMEMSSPWWHSLIHPDDLAGHLAQLEAHLAQGGAQVSEYRVLHKSGAWIIVQDNRIVIQNDARQAVRLIGAVTDITARKQSEADLRESEARFRVLADSSPVLIWVNGMTGAEFVNRAYLQFLGVTPTDVRNYDWGQFVHPDDRQAYLDAYFAAFARRLPFSAQFRFRRADGEYRWMSSAARPRFRESGEFQGYCGSTFDITDIKRAEAAQAQYAQQLEVRVRERTAELEQSREQLRVLTMHLQALREEERARMSREIHDELGQELTGLKMELAQARKGQSDPRLVQKLNALSSTVDNTIQTVRRLATELRPGILDDFGLPAAIEWHLQDFGQRVGITCQLLSALDKVELDRDQATAVFRVFQETLTNVARHANATRVEVELKQLDNHLILQVRDNGRGISDQELSGAKSLGLLGMRERMRLIAGELEIEGAPERGTTVLVRLPLKPSPLAGAPPLAAIG